MKARKYRGVWIFPADGKELREAGFRWTVETEHRGMLMAEDWRSRAYTLAGARSLIRAREEARNAGF